MAAEPTLEEIMSAIEDSGYLMEQKAATQVEQLGYYVRTNVAFEDSEEGKSREIDVLAVKRVARNEDAKLSAFVELIVECKNNSNPFVFIARPKNEVDQATPPAHLIFPYEYQRKKDLEAVGHR